MTLEGFTKLRFSKGPAGRSGKLLCVGGFFSPCTYGGANFDYFSSDSCPEQTIMIGSQVHEKGGSGLQGPSCFMASGPGMRIPLVDDFFDWGGAQLQQYRPDFPVQLPIGCGSRNPCCLPCTCFISDGVWTSAVWCVCVCVRVACAHVYAAIAHTRARWRHEHPCVSRPPLRAARRSTPPSWYISPRQVPAARPRVVRLRVCCRIMPPRHLDHSRFPTILCPCDIALHRLA